MSVLYHHRQRATVILLSLLLTAPVVLIVVVLSLQSPIDLKGITVVGGAVLALLAGNGWYFSSMTVEVTDDELRWCFGLGGYYRIARRHRTRVAGQAFAVLGLRHPVDGPEALGLHRVGQGRGRGALEGRRISQARDQRSR